MARPRCLLPLLACLALTATAPAALGDELIVNGGFEAGGGSFAGWTRFNQSMPSQDSGNWFIQSGMLSPLFNFGVPSPPEGTHAAMTDQTMQGGHVLEQSFVVPAGGVSAATLSFQRFLGNRSPFGFVTPIPATLDFNFFANQQARVDVLRTGADPFSVAPADVLLNLFQTMPGDPLVSGYTLQSNDLTGFLNAHAGETLTLRFAEVDNAGFFEFGIDAVSLNVTPAQGAAGVPEPATLALLGVGAAGLTALRRRKRTV
jgi:hypothetical protein